MKRKNNFITYLIFMMCVLLSCNELFAHKERVHQHLAIEAYKLLKLRYPLLASSIMETRIGTQTGSCSGRPWKTGTITGGAYREDCEDVVYEYHLISGTHFWDADAGDGSKANFAGIVYENAYQKAQKYLKGG